MTTAPRLIVEPATPFVSWEDLEELKLDDQPETRSIIFDLLSSPERAVQRLLQEKGQRPLLASLMVIALGTSAFATISMMPQGWLMSLRASLLLSGNTLLALAAALGPIYATSILIATRLPMARLVGVLLMSAASSSMILMALSPVPHMLYKLDPQWAFPISLLTACALSGVAGGLRLRALLYQLAAAQGASAEDAQRFRIGVLARMSMVLTAFTLALSHWGFDAFVR